MFKFLLYLGLGYMAYLIIKPVARSLGLWPQAPRPVEKDQGPDLLVQDPVCKTFIPRREALRTEKGGATYFFCSEGCLKRFQSSDKS
ncbi:MAG: YHS domain-containing protein [Proteobacteria bacterium]|nr:YHS domain-containing protein [Pseudomonadota bacterium]MBU4354016.1 YHS domain-containing protein [Pseudomonadota bacterium]MBU4446977.1 YHS domain-containing protein [Pseudomonadota bacterium]MCG2773043.1 YHS domain-containing protein [Desulfobacterales bacterium]